MATSRRRGWGIVLGVLGVSASTVAAEMGTGAKVEDVDALALSATPASGLSTG
jgi:hypothetical protein